MTSHPRCIDMEEQLHPESANEGDSTSPFSFLSDVQKDRVEAIHKLLLCDLPHQWKNAAIEAVFEKNETLLDKFDSWKWKFSKVSGSSEEETILHLAKESLKTWIARREHQIEKRKVVADEMESVSKKMRKENEEPLDELATTVSVMQEKNECKNSQKLGPRAANDPDQKSKEISLQDTKPPCIQCENNSSSTARKPSPTLFPKNEKVPNHGNTAKGTPPREHTSKSSSSTSQSSKMNERKRSKSRQRFPNRQPNVKATNILLLGETGVGKTTFINSFANYLRYSTLEDALAGEPEILVDAAFTVTDSKHKMITIETMANTGADHKLMKGNERLGTKGTSSTQDPVDHIFKWSDNGVEKLIRIIDTPGINDTRGTDQDAKNFEAILEHIAELGELHAICILMKPNEAKFTVGFRYCMDELLVKLHKKATKNILFCFTNSRSSQYRPGDTLSTLHEYLKKMENETGVLITADRKNIFCYDNDCFRYLCVIRQIPSWRDKSTMLTFAQGWEHNIQESNKMLMKVQGMSAHSVEDTVAINNTRKLVAALARPLAEIAKNHVVNMQIIQERIEEIEKLKTTGNALNDKMFQEQTVLETVKLDHPRTVCTSPQCVTYVKLDKHQVHTVPKVICHDACYLQKIPEQCLNNPGLASCEAFRKNGSCEKCGCSWKQHMHISYEFKHAKENVMDQNVKFRLEHCWDRKKEAEKLLNEEKTKFHQMEREHDIIRDSCAEFAAFLATNSMKLTSDPYEDYLNYLMEDEINKIDNGGGSEFMAGAICDMVHYYKKKLGSITEEIKAGKRNALTTSELKNQIDNLSRLKICGPIIAQLKDVHLHEVTAVSEYLTEECATTSSVSSNKKSNSNSYSDKIRTTDGNQHENKKSREIHDRFKTLSVDSNSSSTSLFGSNNKKTPWI